MSVGISFLLHALMSSLLATTLEFYLLHDMTQGVSLLLWLITLISSLQTVLVSSCNNLKLGSSGNMTADYHYVIWYPLS